METQAVLMNLSPSNLLSVTCVFLNILQPVEASLSLDRTIQECAADVVDALRNLPKTKLS